MYGAARRSRRHSRRSHARHFYGGVNTPTGMGKTANSLPQLAKEATSNGDGKTVQAISAQTNIETNKASANDKNIVKGFCKSVYEKRKLSKKYSDMSKWEKTRYKLCKHIFSRKQYVDEILSKKPRDQRFYPVFAKKIKTGGGRRTRRSRRASRKASWF